MTKVTYQKRIYGIQSRPRLIASITNRQVIAQLIDDSAGKTLAYSSSLASKTKGSMTEKASWVGDDIAKKAKSAKIKKVVFDRGGKKYHGRLQALADSARKGGLEF